MSDFTFRIHNEKEIDGFTNLDGTVHFFTFVNAILRKTSARDVLDFGAGRGAAFRDGGSDYQKYLRNLKKFGAKVTACDIDDAVLAHPCSDHQVLVRPGENLPFGADAFDVIVSDMTFEHIDDTTLVSKELVRILRPGGFICVRTPNRFGYVRFMSGLLPSSIHIFALKYIQPGRKHYDVFPAYYKMNSVNQIRRLFKNCRVNYFYDSSEPAYHFNNSIIYRFFMLLHRVLPPMLSTTVCFFIHKP
jgi:SAM-dependent methyltransferase